LEEAVIKAIGIGVGFQSFDPDTDSDPDTDGFWFALFLKQECSKIADKLSVAMICPKCGFFQEEGTECLRCGVVFNRFRKTESLPIAQEKRDRKASLLYRSYRVFRWAGLAGLILVLFLILHESSPPEIAIAPDAAEKAEVKMQQFMSSAGKGIPARLRMNESELNGWLDTHLDIHGPRESGTARPQTLESALSLAKKAAAPQELSDSELAQMRSSIRDVKIELKEDSLRVYAQFDLHGLDLSLDLEGRPSVQEGYLRLAPTAGKLGSLPLAGSTLQILAERIFDSPQNKEKFKLPYYIEDVQIEDGQLIITSK
jgi:hypothetical protein